MHCSNIIFSQFREIYEWDVSCIQQLGSPVGHKIRSVVMNERLQEDSAVKMNEKIVPYIW